ncbi:hybrid signal transduction histidine kinase, partial [Achlya hypogyna]
MPAVNHKAILEAMGSVVFELDMHGVVTYMNHRAECVLACCASDIVGTSFVASFVPAALNDMPANSSYRANIEKQLKEVLSIAETAVFKCLLKTRGTPCHLIDMLLSVAPRLDSQRNVLGCVLVGTDVTHHASEKISSEPEYTRLIDTANAPIFGVDQNGNVNIWNKKAAEITQYTQKEVMGQNLVEKFISEDYRKAVGYVLSKALTGVETANLEFALVTKTDRCVQILLNATPRYNELGDVIGVHVYSRILERANAPIFGVDVNGRVNIWNKKAAELTQYAPEEVMGQDLVDAFIAPDYRQAVGSVLSQALNGVETANFEFPLDTKSGGRQLEILLNATSRYDEVGNIVGVVGIGQDITDRVAQEQEYSRLIDKANAPIFGVDAELRVNIWNQKIAEITQYSDDEVMGQNIIDKFISEEYRHLVNLVLTQALKGYETADFEVPLVTKTGRKVNILLNATARFDQMGDVIGVVGIGQDITERIAQEQEYTRLID